MHCSKTRFSLFALALCLGFALPADAAPSVRVLGSSAGYSTAGTKAASGADVKAAKTGENISASVLNANAGAKKSASVKSIAPKTSTAATGTPAARIASNRGGGVPTKTAVTSTNAERFPGLVTKSNVQSIGKTSAVTSGTTTTSGYNVKEMNDRLTILEQAVDTKANIADYYTKAEVDAKVNVGPSSALVQEVSDHAARLVILEQLNNGIYDVKTDTMNNVYLEPTFDAATVLGEE